MVKEKFLSFTEAGEDIILYNVFKEIMINERIFYIDVGANNPWSSSITKTLYEKGARGINIEPLPNLFEELCEDRTEDENINCGVGSQSKYFNFLPLLKLESILNF